MIKPFVRKTSEKLVFLIKPSFFSNNAFTEKTFSLIVY